MRPFSGESRAAPGALLLRADAGPEIGAGHLMRSLALAQAWHAAGGRATLLSCCESEALRSRVEEAGVDFAPLARAHPHPVDRGETLARLGQLSGAGARPWLALDGYHLDPEYARACRQAGFPVLIIDDNAHLPRYHADIVLNQNLHAPTLEYRCDPDTHLLLGTRYALLRPEFVAQRREKPDVPEAGSRVLVTLGGSDPGNVTLRVLRALSEVPEIVARVVIGAANPHRESLRRTAAADSRIELLFDVHDMPHLMRWANVAISAAGSTCWELACLGVPAIVLTIAPNQRGNACGISEAGAALSLGEADAVTDEVLPSALERLLRDPGLRRRMAERGRGLVDGEGAARVAATLRETVT